ncbi:putative aminotransferase TAT2-like [Capsicum annuum]|nr:putative aminotransferase TAT2-like [Capsicum annuum]
MESSSASQEQNEVQTNLPSSVVRPVSRTGAPNNNHNNSNSNMVMGKHRLAAAIAALNQQIHIIQGIDDVIFSVSYVELIDPPPSSTSHRTRRGRPHKISIPISILPENSNPENGKTLKGVNGVAASLISSEDTAMLTAKVVPEMNAVVKKRVKLKKRVYKEELDQLDSCGEASLVCGELVSSVELIPDALLPVTRGPINVHLDRWFHGANDSRRNKRWI